MSEQSTQSDILILQVIEQVEKRILDRETKRFRLLYGMVALVSFIGIGVISQLIELYSTRAVEQRLEASKVELESTKTYTQLLALATKLDISNSFTNTDRDSVMRLLDAASQNKKLRSEPVFESLLEKIIDSFDASDNDAFVSRIYDTFQHECLGNDGIVQTLVQHYASRVLQATILKSDSFDRDLRRFHAVADSADTFGNKGLVAGLRSLVAYRLADQKKTVELDAAMVSYDALTEKQRKMFKAVIQRYSDVSRMSDIPTPDLIRISKVGSAFKAAYATDLVRLETAGAP